MPRLLNDLVAQQVTVQPAVDEVALYVRQHSGASQHLQQWQTSGGTWELAVDHNRNLLAANGKGIYFTFPSGNLGYITGTASNDLDIRGGSSGVRILNNAGNATLVDITDAGDVTITALDDLRTQAHTNKVINIPTGSGTTGDYMANTPLAPQIWHDLLGWSRWFGTPTFERYNGTIWAATTLDTGIFARQENRQSTIIDGTTYTAARWTWNSAGNVPWSYIEWWVLGIPYSAVAVNKNFLIESSADGNTWTTRHTSTGNTASGQPIFLYQSPSGGDQYLRLTITVNNGQALLLSTMRALTARWANQGAGSEMEFPYSWDASQRMAIGAGAVAANGPLTIGTNTTASSGGLWFGTDTALYRSGNTALTVAGSLAATGGIVSSAYSTASTGITFDTSVQRALRLVQAAAWSDSQNASFLQIGPNTPDAGGAVIQGGSGAVHPRLMLNSTKIVAWDGAYGSAPVPGSATTLMVACSAAGTMPLVVRGFTGQTANLQEWQDNSGAVLAAIDEAGNFTAANYPSAGGTTSIARTMALMGA